MAIAGSETYSGTTSETSRLHTNAEMPAAHTNVSGVSSKLEVSFKCREIAVVASCNVHDTMTLLWYL